MATRTPCAASFKAMPRPIPREPPVINACFPVSAILASYRVAVLLLRGIRLHHMLAINGLSWNGVFLFSASGQFLQQRLGVFQIRSIKSFGEPMVDWCQKVTGFLAFALL